CARTTDSWNASGSLTCNIAAALTTFEGDKASHVKIRGFACDATQRHIRGTPDTARRSRSRRDGMGTPVVSEEIRAYCAGLLKQVEATYAVARAARTRGFDPELDVEIPLTDDLASRVERLLEHYEVEGVARRIRELAKTHDWEELAILVAKEMAVRPATSKEKAVDRAGRRGDLAHRLQLSRRDRRRRHRGRGDQRASRPPADRDEPHPRRRVPRHRGRDVPEGAEDPEAREETPDRRMGVHRRIPRAEGVAARGHERRIGRRAERGVHPEHRRGPSGPLPSESARRPAAPIRSDAGHGSCRPRPPSRD